MDPDPFARLDFSAHARERWRQRFGGDFDRTAAGGEVRCAILEGRFSHEQPRWSILPGNRAAIVEEFVVFVWPATCARAWVIVFSRDGSSATVKTLLIGAEELHDRKSRQTDLRHVRVGYAPR